MKINLEKLQADIQPRSRSAVRNTEKRIAATAWRSMSQDIALAIYHYLHKNKITQKVFAARLGVSPAYVAKILKGNENLTLETISRIEDAVGSKIVHIDRPYEATFTISFSPKPNTSTKPSCCYKYSGKAEYDNYSSISSTLGHAV